MCLTLPAQVVDLSGDSVGIKLFDGKIQTLPASSHINLNLGDWVLYGGSYLAKKISAEEAQELKELLGHYDAKALTAENQRLREIFQLPPDAISRDDLKYLLTLASDPDLAAFYAQANLVRKQNIKDHICIHGIIEFSNYCRNNCRYCGLSADNQDLKRYRLAEEEIVDLAVQAVNKKGYKILVLQAGEDNYYDAKKIIRIINEIKKQARVFIYLSIGDRSLEDYQLFRQAGAAGVLYRFETANPSLFSRLKPGKNLSDRLAVLRELKNRGYIISTGMLIGLPGQTLDDLIEDLLLLRELQVFMPSFGPFLPTLGTPLAKNDPPEAELIVKIMAACRLLLPKSRLPVTTAMETLAGGEEARKACFLAGANSIMLNLTPTSCRKQYKIYDNKFFDDSRKYESWGLFAEEASYLMLEQELGFKI